MCSLPPFLVWFSCWCALDIAKILQAVCVISNKLHPSVWGLFSPINEHQTGKGSYFLRLLREQSDDPPPHFTAKSITREKSPWSCRQRSDVFTRNTNHTVPTEFFNAQMQLNNSSVWHFSFGFISLFLFVIYPRALAQCYTAWRHASLTATVLLLA